jgi:glycosyltransferase involved in cell wall biosynthesis
MGKNKKILFLGRFPPPIHGAAKMNEFYFKGLDSEKEINIKKIKLNYSSDVGDLGKFNLKKFFGVFIVLYSLIKQLITLKPNIIYFEIAPRGFAFFRDSLFVIVCKLFRKDIIFHIHARNFTRSKYAKFIFNNTKTIILSELLYKNIKTIVNKKNTFILNNGIPNELTQKEFKKIIKTRQMNKKYNLLFLSNMMESKGSLETLEICKELKKKKINFKCNFAGAWDNEETQKRWIKLRKENDLIKECKYLGLIKGKKKKEILSKTDMLIFPTNYGHECFPVVILESFMFGIPVMTYNTGAIKNIVKKSYLGYVSKTNNPNDLIKEIRKRIKKKTQQVKIRNHFKKHYLLKNTIKKLKKILITSNEK